MHAGLIFDIKRYSLHDGPDILDLVEGAVRLDAHRCLDHGACADACPGEARRRV